MPKVYDVDEHDLDRHAIRLNRFGCNRIYGGRFIFYDAVQLAKKQ
jgi:hypothetical protein